MILVTRANKAPAVPSDIIQCDICHAECWLSKYSGQSTIALAMLTGDTRFVCEDCIVRII